jgi:hypothetical protein
MKIGGKLVFIRQSSESANKIVLSKQGRLVHSETVVV